MGGRARREANRIARESLAFTKEQVKMYLAEQEKQRKILAKQKAEYRTYQFKNPYANMENFYEELPVATQAAEFQMEVANQQRANIMSQLRGAAGGSGIAGLAQALAMQGTLQARQVSTDIQRQEAYNAIMRAKGASAADMAERGGEAMLQSAEMSRQSTMLGIEYGGMQGANAGVQGAYVRRNHTVGLPSP